MKRLSYIIAIVILVSACSESSSDSMSNSESGTGGSMARFTIVNDVLYTVDNQTLKLFDVSTPGNPSYLSTLDQNIGFGIETIFSRSSTDTLLFIGSQFGMYVYNIKNKLPSKIGQVEHISSCDPVVANSDYAFVTLNSANLTCGRNVNRLQVYDIKNLKQIKLVHEENMTRPLGLGIDGNKLFVCDNGLRVYDITDPKNPSWIDDSAFIPEVGLSSAYDLIPVNGLLIVVSAQGLYQFDYTGPKLSLVSKLAINQ